jgi:hypothetical protein
LKNIPKNEDIERIDPTSSVLLYLLFKITGVTYETIPSCRDIKKMMTEKNISGENNLNFLLGSKFTN